MIIPLVFLIIALLCAIMIFGILANDAEHPDYNCDYDNLYIPEEDRIYDMDEFDEFDEFIDIMEEEKESQKGDD